MFTVAMAEGRGLQEIWMIRVESKSERNATFTHYVTVRICGGDLAEVCGRTSGCSYYESCSYHLRLSQPLATSYDSGGQFQLLEQAAASQAELGNSLEVRISERAEFNKFPRFAPVFDLTGGIRMGIPLACVSLL